MLPPLPPSEPPPGALPPVWRGPRSSFRLKLYVLLAVVAVVPSIVCMVAFHELIENMLKEKEQREGDVLAEFVALTLSGRVNGYTTQSGDLLDSIKRDDRVAFAMVTDSTGFPLHFGVQDSSSFDRFRNSPAFDAIGRRINVKLRHSQGMFGDTTVRIAPIRDLHGSSDQGEPEGYVVLGLHEAMLRRMFTEYGAVQVGAVTLATFLAAPLAAILLRRWTRPLAHLVEATRQLAAGGEPGAIRVRSRDEIGHLSASFNDMASRLVQTRRALINLNESLESEVRDRTSELETALDRLENIAMTDPLTGLCNRRAFQPAFASAFALASERAEDLAVVAIDLDGFKLVNDQLGHEAGDAVLVLAAEGLRARTRKGDTCVRLGGDEFALVMPRAGVATARDVAERVRTGFQEDAARKLSGAAALKVSMSMGLVSLGGSGAKTPEELLAIADAALYEAKRAGKSRLVIHQPKLRLAGDRPIADAA